MARIINGTTDGVSPKAVAAFFWPFIATLLASAASWIATGNFNLTEVRLALAGLVLSIIAAGGAAIGKTGTVVSPEPLEIDHSGLAE